MKYLLIIFALTVSTLASAQDGPKLHVTVQESWVQPNGVWRVTVSLGESVHVMSLACEPNFDACVRPNAGVLGEGRDIKGDGATYRGGPNYLFWWNDGTASHYWCVASK